jgi:hypothetical protein
MSKGREKWGVESEKNPTPPRIHDELMEVWDDAFIILH